MTNLPGGPASAAAQATAQLQGLDWRGDAPPEPASEPPLSPEAAELILLQELADQMLQPLDRRDRRAVNRAVRCGVAVHDRRLAVAAVAVAQWRSRDAMATRPWRGSWSVWVGPGLLLAAVLLGVGDDDSVKDTVFTLLGIVSLVAAVVGTARLFVPARRRAARAARAEELNRLLWPTNVQPGG